MECITVQHEHLIELIGWQVACVHHAVIAALLPKGPICLKPGTRAGTQHFIAARTCPLWSVGRSGRPETRVHVGSAHRSRLRKKATLQQNTCKRIGESAERRKTTLLSAVAYRYSGYWGQVRVDPSTWYLPPKFVTAHVRKCAVRNWSPKLAYRYRARCGCSNK